MVRLIVELALEIGAPLLWAITLAAAIIIGLTLKGKRM